MLRLQTAAALKPSPRDAERRRHYRVPVAVLGRYMLPNRQEYPCQTVNMSPGGVLFVAPVKGAVGDRVIAYLEHIGRIEGQIARHVPDGFAMTVAATPRLAGTRLQGGGGVQAHHARGRHRRDPETRTAGLMPA